jgi:methylenetetrahydrofolate reductase (NADPH)
MDAIKDDTDAVKKFGVEYGIEMCSDLIKIGVEVLHFYTLNLEKVTYGILEGLGFEVKSDADESDAASMVAKGSAWARVGDNVKTKDGAVGVVLEILKDGSAKIALSDRPLEKPTVTLPKDQYSKVF